MPGPTAIYRAPMRARVRDDVPPGAGAEHAVERRLVATGDVLPGVPPSVEDAATAAARAYGEKAGRMLRRFAELPDGTLVWTRETSGLYRLGCIDGPWRYDGSASAHAVGLHHVRPARWLARPFGEDEVPAAVAATFARGGRNLQRIHGSGAERRTAELWSGR